MANRIQTLNTFASLTPPWLLTSLDQNSSFLTTGFNDSSLGWSNGVPTDTGSINIYSIVLPYGSPTAYNPGMLVYFIPSNGNTGPSTITVNPLGTVPIVTKANVALGGGEIVKNKVCGLVFDGTSFRIFTYCARSANYSGASNLTINCAGYDAVSALMVVGVTSTSILMQNLEAGTSVNLSFVNPSGNVYPYAMEATAPETNSPATYTITWTPMTSVTGSGRTIFQNGNTVNTNSLGAGQALVFSGISFQTAPSNYFLSF